MNRRIDVDRIELDLRGIDPALAEAAVRLFGPALQAELARGIDGGRSVARLDAGRVASIDTGRIAAEADAGTLAARLAQRVAGTLKHSGS